MRDLYSTQVCPPLCGCPSGYTGVEASNAQGYECKPVSGVDWWQEPHYIGPVAIGPLPGAPPLTLPVEPIADDAISPLMAGALVLIAYFVFFGGR